MVHVIIPSVFFSSFKISKQGDFNNIFLWQNVTICIFDCIFVDQFFKLMETEKTIDANKQGHPLLTDKIKGNTKKLYIESYGCQMNLNDSEIVASILSENNYNTTQLLEEADLVLVNTCSIREKAEQTIRKRLQKYNAIKRINPTMKVGV